MIESGRVDFKEGSACGNMLKIDKIVNNFRLIEGSAETSGGLLVYLHKDQADSFV